MGPPSQRDRGYTADDTELMMRVLDLCFALAGLIVLSPLLIIVLAICWFDIGSPLFLQKRVGLHRKSFTLLKFRTMPLGTESVATHLVDRSAITPFGHFMRTSKLDELPQLWNVLVGHMSLVGPRPSLCNQLKVIAAREKLGVYRVRPGITGLAQIRRIDMSNPKLLAETDIEMIANLNVYHYFKYILFTIMRRGDVNNYPKKD